MDIPKDNNQPMVPLLNFSGKIPVKGGPFLGNQPLQQQQKPAAAGVPPLKIPPIIGIPEKAAPPVASVDSVVDDKPKVPKFGLNLENIKKKDFQDEFMEKFDEYSKSWRDMIEQQKRF